MVNFKVFGAIFLSPDINLILLFYIKIFIKNLHTKRVFSSRLIMFIGSTKVVLKVYM